MSVAQPVFFCFDGCPYLIFLQNGSGGNESLGAYALVRGSSNLIEPTRTTPAQR